MRIGIAHHLGWAVAVCASEDHEVIDRRRIELVEPGVPAAPVEHEIAGLDDAAAAALVSRVRASVVRASARSLDELAGALRKPVASVSLRSWPRDFPTAIGALRRAHYASRADSVMYCEVLAELAHKRGWAVHLYDAKEVESQAAARLGMRANEVLHGPRAMLGAPWAKDHRMALAATIMADDDPSPTPGVSPRGSGW